MSASRSARGRSPDPKVVLCENFEDEEFEHRWDIGGHQGIWPISQFALCTDDHSVSTIAVPRGATSWYSIASGAFMATTDARRFPPQSEFYVRWYQYIGDPFVWGTLEDKSVMLHDQANTLVAYVGTNRNHLPVIPDSGPGKPFVANYQDVDTPETGGQYNKVNRFQNQGKNITLQPGQWYLFEWYVKLNDAGQSNGVTRLWIDAADKPITKQTLRMEYTDMRWLKTRDAGKQFGVVRLTVYHQRCDIGPNTCPPNGPAVLAQSQRWDQIVISRAPIGPMVEAAQSTQVP